MLSLRDSSDPSFVGESQAGAVILVALDRWSSPWYKEIPQMLADQLLIVAQFLGILSQEGGVIGSLPTLSQSLHVCFLREAD